MIRHTVAEGMLLLRRRLAVSAALALGLTIPVTLAGLTVAVDRWLLPLVEKGSEASTVAVLLHPGLDESERQTWLAEQREAHPEWAVDQIPPRELRARLIHWFPYLNDLLGDEGDSLLPDLVEIETEDPEGPAHLATDPAVIAVGPRSSVHRLIRQASLGLGWFLTGISLVLVVSAALLAGVWVHLELYRHADEITVMRLIGATEGAIRGPLLLAVTVPGGAAAVMAPLATSALARIISDAISVLGLPPIAMSASVMVLQAAVAATLPVFAAVLVLARHAHDDLD
jgi:cell division protein FtsX